MTPGGASAIAASLIWPRSKAAAAAAAAGPGEEVGTGPFLTLIAFTSLLSFPLPITKAAFCFSGQEEEGEEVLSQIKNSAHVVGKGAPFVTKCD